MIKEVNFMFKGRWFTDDASEPDYEVEYCGLFNSYADIRKFIFENIEDPEALDGLDYLTEIVVKSIKMIDAQAIDFDKWELKK